jgi:hypothetical protein
MNEKSKSRTIIASPYTFTRDEYGGWKKCHEAWPNDEFTLIESEQALAERFVKLVDALIDQIKSPPLDV